MPRLDSKAILQGRRSRYSLTLILGIVLSVVFMAGMFVYLWGLALAGGAAAGIDGATGFVVSVLAAVVPVTALIPLILLLDRLEPEPRSVLFFAFVWGAGVAVVASLILNAWGMRSLAVPLFGPDTGGLVATSVVAPIVEESAKGLVLLLLLWRRRQELDTYTDGVVYGGMVAVGFAFSENILYFLGAFFEGNLVAAFMLRGIVAPFGHPVYTAVIGIGVAYAAMHTGWARFLAPVAGWAVAVGLHGMWNGAAQTGWVGLGMAYGVVFVVALAIVGLSARDRSDQIAAIDHYLPPYVSTGLVTPADITMLSSVSQRREARTWARRNAGSKGRSAMKEYQLAATELALLHQKISAGRPSGDWKKRRDSYLALMHASRETFLGRVERPAAPGWVESPTDSGFLRRADFEQVIARAQDQQEPVARRARRDRP